MPCSSPTSSSPLALSHVPDCELTELTALFSSRAEDLIITDYHFDTDLDDRLEFHINCKLSNYLSNRMSISISRSNSNANSY